MGKIIKRVFSLNLPKNRSAFLWGPRKVGKSHWINHQLPKAPLIDLLKSDVFAEYATRPALLRERFASRSGLIVIDEIQMVPALLDEVHWLIENTSLQFLLTGSSARKLRKEHANMLGGRAWRRTMTPLCYPEISKPNLRTMMRSGLMPSHYLSENPREDLRAYVADYLKEEIAAEASSVNLPAFGEFLKVAALTSSELLNYINIGREAGISHKTVRHYFQILEDTYLAHRVPAWKKTKNRRMILTEKFYLFDVGITNHLTGRDPAPATPEFGKSFEHYILMELKAFQAYRNPDLPIHYWRTSTGLEVDFILGDMEMALEVKGSSKVHDSHTKGLRALVQETKVKHKIVVCLEKEPRVMEDNIHILPWTIFLEKLWGGDLIKS